MTNLFSRNIPVSVTIRGPICSLTPSLTRHFALGCSNSPAFTLSARTLGLKRKQSSLGNQQVRQAKQRKELCGVLRQSAIPCLLQRKHVLDDVKGVLDLGPHAGLGVLDPFAQSPAFGVRQRTALARPHGHVPSYVRISILFPFLDALIARIPENRRLIAMQQGMSLSDVADMGCRSDDSVGQSGSRIYTNMCLHAEVPLIAFFGLVHLGSRLPSRFLVEDGAAMIVASTTVPSRSIRPLAARCTLMAAKMRSVSW